MRPSALATLAVALLASLAPVVRGDDKPAPTPPAPAPTAPEKPEAKPDEKPQPPRTRHYFREYVSDFGRKPQASDALPAKVELTREQVVNEVARVVWTLLEKRGKDGKIVLTDEELAAGIKQYNEAGGASYMERMLPAYRTRIVVVETADVNP